MGDFYAVNDNRMEGGARRLLREVLVPHKGCTERSVHCRGRGGRGDLRLHYSWPAGAPARARAARASRAPRAARRAARARARAAAARPPIRGSRAPRAARRAARTRARAATARPASSRARAPRAWRPAGPAARAATFSEHVAAVTRGGGGGSDEGRRPLLSFGRCGRSGQAVARAESQPPPISQRLRPPVARRACRRAGGLVRRPRPGAKQVRRPYLQVKRRVWRGAPGRGLHGNRNRNDARTQRRRPRTVWTPRRDRDPHVPSVA